jgi:protein involved in polysaccharide export with SLBB domain
MTLEDILLQANGFAENASLREVTVTRMVETQGQEGRRARTLEVPLVDRDIDPKNVDFSVQDTARVLENAADFTLQHRDRIFVRQDPAFQPQRTVTVEGEVEYPGEYTLLRDNERLSSVLQRAGGVLPTGYLKGGRLMRAQARTNEGFQERSSKEQVIVEMSRAMRGDPASDVILQPGDEIIIPSQPNTVAVRGNVANEGLIKHKSGRRVDYYLDRAGGARDSTQAIYLTQASGATFRVRTGWFRRTPEVDDGAVIRVAREQPRRREQTDYGQIATEITSILSSALTVIVLATRAFN